jgi:hypothetical protein
MNFVRSACDGTHGAHRRMEQHHVARGDAEPPELRR